METQTQPTVEHDRTNPKAPLDNLAHIACLFLQLADRALFRTLTWVHQASRNLNHYSIGRRSPLLLQHDVRCVVGLRGVF